MSDVFLGFQPRPSDIFIAVMGMTGSGKSTFISLCTGKDVPVTAYQCKWTDTTDIYLLDTPGFDDTNRSDTEVLIEIAGCLTKTYEDDIQLSGILYLHRITDRRMGGSAKKNLMMFRKLCGKDSLKNVILVTTMWEDEQPATGAKREQELIETNGFWGALVEEGAQINRHNNTRASAMALLKSITKNNRVTISIQKEMVSERKNLNETEAGIGLNSDILLAEQRVKKEMSEALEMERQARKDQDERSAEEQRQYREKMQQKFDHLNQEREKLKVGLQEMEEQRRLFKELQEKYRESQELMRQHDEKIESLEQREIREQLALRTEKASMELQNLRLQMNSKDKEILSPSSMRPRSSRSHYANGSRGLVLFLAGSYHFLGYRHDHYLLPQGLTQIREVNDHRRVCVLGTRGSWLYHYHTGNSLKCWTCWSDSLATEYPKLVRWLEEGHDLGCFRHISLGANGYFFVSMTNGYKYWHVPVTLSDRIKDRTGDRDIGNISRLWLGYDHDYVAESDNNGYIFSVKNYGRLGTRLGDINDEKATMKQLAMNIEDSRGYIMVLEGGATAWNTGSSDTRFTFSCWEGFRDANNLDW